MPGEVAELILAEVAYVLGLFYEVGRPQAADTLRATLHAWLARLPEPVTRLLLPPQPPKTTISPQAIMTTPPMTEIA